MICENIRDCDVMSRGCASNHQIIYLGRIGENLARNISFDISEWCKTYGSDGVPQLMFRPSVEDSTVLFITSLTITDDYRVVWDIKASEIAGCDHHSHGSLQLIYRVTHGEDTIVVKSSMMTTKIDDSIGEGIEPPSEYKTWIDNIIELNENAQSAVDAASNALLYADRAEQAAIHQPIPSSETDTWWVWNINTKEYEDSGERVSGNLLYPVFSVDENGQLCIEYPDKYSGPTFAMNESGELEVYYE